MLSEKELARKLAEECEVLSRRASVLAEKAGRGAEASGDSSPLEEQPLIDRAIAQALSIMLLPLVFASVVDLLKTNEAKGVKRDG